MKLWAVLCDLWSWERPEVQLHDGSWLLRLLLGREAWRVQCYLPGALPFQINFVARWTKSPWNIELNLDITEHESRPCGSEGVDGCCQGDCTHARKLCQGGHNCLQSYGHGQLDWTLSQPCVPVLILRQKTPNESCEPRCTPGSASNWGQTLKQGASSRCWPRSRLRRRSSPPSTPPPLLRWMSWWRTWFATARSFTRSTNRSRWRWYKTRNSLIYDAFQDEESGTSDVVKSLIETSALLGKVICYCDLRTRNQLHF